MKKKLLFMLFTMFLMFCFSGGILAADLTDGDGTGTRTSPASGSGTITVTFRLIGDTVHGNGTKGHEKYVNWIATHSYTFHSDNVTVYDVFTRALDGAGLRYIGAADNYVRTITSPANYGSYNLSEFNNGTYSGWMYTLNGEHPKLGLTQQTLTDGDVIVWHYVDNYLEETEADAIYPNRWLEADDTEPAYITANIAIDDLPEAADVKVNDKTAIKAARAAYNALSATEKSYISDDCLAKLVAIEDAFGTLKVEPIVDVAKMTDVSKNAWYYDSVSYVLAQGIMYGSSSTTFDPVGNITRGQFVTILGRYAGIADSNASSPATTSFADVNATSYYASHVAWAAENGITSGTSLTTFDPNAKITRQDMAAMMLRFANVLKVDLPDGSGASLFADDGDISTYAKTAVYSMAEAKIINGMGNDRFSPKATATRAQAATIIRLLIAYAE